MPHKRNPVVSRARQRAGARGPRARRRPRSRTSRCGTSATSRTRRPSAIDLARRDGPARVHAARHDLGDRRARACTPSGCARNLDSRGGLAFSQRCCSRSSRPGMARDDAYRIVQRAAAAAWDEGASFRDELAEDPEVIARLDAGRACDALFDPTAVPGATSAPVFDAPRGAPGGGGAARDAVLAHGQGPRPLRRRRRPAAAGRDRPHQRVRRRLADADPRQGPRADRPVAVLVRADGDLVAEPRGRGRPRPVPAAVRRRRSSRAGRCSCGAPTSIPLECVVRGYLSGSGWTQYRERGSVCGVRAPAGWRNGDGCPSRSSRRRRRPERATTCRSRRRGARPGAARARTSGCAS